MCCENGSTGLLLVCLFILSKLSLCYTNTVISCYSRMYYAFLYKKKYFIQIFGIFSVWWHFLQSMLSTSFFTFQIKIFEKRIFDCQVFNNKEPKIIKVLETLLLFTISQFCAEMKQKTGWVCRAEIKTFGGIYTEILWLNGFVSNILHLTSDLYTYITTLTQHPSLNIPQYFAFSWGWIEFIHI